MITTAPHPHPGFFCTVFNVKAKPIEGEQCKMICVSAQSSVTSYMPQQTDLHTPGAKRLIRLHVVL